MGFKRKWGLQAVFYNLEALSFFTNYNYSNNSNNKPFYTFETRGVGVGGGGASDLSFCFSAFTY